MINIIFTGTRYAYTCLLLAYMFLQTIDIRDDSFVTDIVIQDYADTPFAKMVPDSGVEVSGMFTGARESASAFLGLEENAAGQRFRQTLIKAAADAKK